MAEVSIIVPAYNAEMYLERCIDSILNQSFFDIEVIIVNDGSEDKTKEICDTYNKKDNRVKVIHKDNEGVSKARNIGIQHSTSKYLQFVDADDFVSIDFTKNLVESMGKIVELSICGFNSLSKGVNKTKEIEIKIPELSGIISIGDFKSNFGELFNGSFINPIWNKMYLSEIIKNHHIHFDETLSMGEDLLFNIKYFKQCQNIFIFDGPLYNYIRYNNLSLTKSYKQDFFQNQKNMYTVVRDFLNCQNQSGNDIDGAYMSSVIDCIENLFHKNNTMMKRSELNKALIHIVKDETVVSCNKDTYYLGARRDFLTKLIKKQNINGLSWYFQLKRIIKTISRR
jgi:glycosyltransferase involved in cell wall biosynthesis